MAAALTQEQLLDVIRIVFGQYRRRLANVSALAGIPEPLDQAPRSGSFQAEQHVLIGCALDAMAGDWATVVRPDLIGPKQSSGNRTRSSSRRTQQHGHLQQGRRADARRPTPQRWRT